jgi:ATP-dependent RNA helicase DBP3
MMPVTMRSICLVAEVEQPEKKKKKKRKDAELEVVEADAMAVDSEREFMLTISGDISGIDSRIALSTGEEKKKQKRKRDVEEEKPEDAKLAASEAKKERKKKRRKESTDKNTPSTSAATPSTLNVTPSTSTSATPAATSSEVTEFLTKHSIMIHTPPDAPETTPVLSFAQLDIPADLRASFKGFKEPTPVQACTWPPALQGRDVVGIAETGR